MSKPIHFELIREVLDAEHDTALAIIDALRWANAPAEQCDRLYAMWCQRQDGRRIIADVFAGDWLIAIVYRDGKREEAEGLGS